MAKAVVFGAVFIIMFILSLFALPIAGAIKLLVALAIGAVSSSLIVSLFPTISFDEPIPEIKRTPEQQIIDDVRKKISKIADLGMILANEPYISITVSKICKAGTIIVTNMETDPSDIKKARLWIESYLDQTINILEQFIKINNTSDKEKLNESFLKTLDDILSYTEGLKTKVEENDLTALQVDMKVFQTLLNEDKVAIR